MFRRNLLMAVLKLFVASSSVAQERYTLRLNPETAFSNFAQIPLAGLTALIGTDRNRIRAILVVQDTKEMGVKSVYLLNNAMFKVKKMRLEGV